MSSAQGIGHAFGEDLVVMVVARAAGALARRRFFRGQPSVFVVRV